MARDFDFIEVAVYAEDGRSSLLGTLHGWQQKEDGWYGHVMIYGPRAEHGGSGMRRDTVRADRLVPLVYCPHNPVTHEIRHRCEAHDLIRSEHKVWT